MVHNAHQCWKVGQSQSVYNIPFRKHAYSNMFTMSPPKNSRFSDRNSDIFHIPAQNINCWYSLEPPRRGGSNEYPQSMFLSRSKKNNKYPCKPQFYYIKVGFKGSKLYRRVFVMLVWRKKLQNIHVIHICKFKEDPVKTDEAMRQSRDVNLSDWVGFQTFSNLSKPLPMSTLSTRSKLN